MNRQKKELLKKIEEMETWIEVDAELGCGFAPPDAYAEMYRVIDRFREELARLMHYKTAEEMYFDERGQPKGNNALQQAKSVQRQKRKRAHNNSRGMER